MRGKGAAVPGTTTEKAIANRTDFEPSSAGLPRLAKEAAV
jgi:hypothetical protein